MPDENTPALKGVPEGVSAADLNPGEVSSGDGVPKAPVINNAPPPKEEVADPNEETFDDPNKKVEPPVEETKTDDPDKKDETTDEVTDDTEYATYNDPSADAIVSTLKEAGVSVADANAIFGDAIEQGDLSKIDVAKLTELVGKTKADMLLLAAQDYYGRTFGRIQETTKAVFEELGGEKNWQTLAAWSKAKQETDLAFKAQAEEFNAMLELGKTSALLATRALVDLYNKDPKNKTLNTKMVQGDSTGNAADVSPLSREEYLAKYKIASEKGDVQEMNRLNAQRQASRKII